MRRRDGRGPDGPGRMSAWRRKLNWATELENKQGGLSMKSGAKWLLTLLGAAAGGGTTAVAMTLLDECSPCDPIKDPKGEWP